MRILAKMCVCMFGICLISTTACRSPRWQAANDLAALQAERRQKVEKTVGLKQSEAEMQLARDAWTFGDRTASLAALDGILEREPGNVQALLLKAEIHLAKDELIDADRSIAIAISHDPKNSTARRLSEIARTKQLAARPLEAQRPTMPMEIAPLPGGSVSQAAYSPMEPGTALADDEQRPMLPEAAQQQPDPSIHRPAEVTSPPDEAMLAAASPIAMPTVVADPGFAETSDRPSDPPFAVESLPAPQFETLPMSVAMEVPAELAEPPAPNLPAKPEGGVPIVLQPEEAAAYERSDVSTGSAEVTDQAASGDSPASGTEFQSAIATRNSIAALAAVEQELTDNPNDPQIPISAAVVALESNQPETAASIARLGIAFHPSCAGLHRTLGAALYRTGDYASSQVALQQALSLDNTAALSYFLMGCVSEKLGDTEAAHTNYARATELDPSLADGE